MKKFYERHKAIHALLNSDRLDKFARFASTYTGLKLDVDKDDGTSCYTKKIYSSSQIILGTNFYPAIFDCDKLIPAEELRDQWRHMAMCYVAVFYHEFFHLCYTDIDYLQSLYAKYDDNFVEFAHQVVNILEDQSIEGTGTKRWVAAKRYLDVLNKAHTSPKAVQLTSEQITKDSDNPGTLLCFLLLLARGYDVDTLPTYKHYEEHKEFIKWGAITCINTDDTRLRHRRQLAYAIQLVKILKFQKPDRGAVDRGGTEEKPEDPGTISSTAREVLAPTNNVSPKPERWDSSINNKPVPTDNDIVNEDFKPTETKAQRGESLDNELSHSLDNVDLTHYNATILANDDPVTGYSHKAYRLNAYKNTSGYISQYKEVASKFKSLSCKTTNVIRKMKGQNASELHRHLFFGTFDPTAAIERGNYRFMKRYDAPSTEADLVFYFLVDNSGSMSGTKSTLAGQALISLCESLNQLHIPFAVGAFTQRGRTCITIKLKDFRESYNNVKTNMTLFTEQFNVDELSTFWGNIDEENLKYVRDVLMQQRQKDKVCVVISDGATCGSWEDLRKVAQGMQQMGITVLGIGIYDNNVEKIYDNHIVLKTRDDLAKLPQFFQQYLISKIFKNGGEK
jgi:Mg-chelatase subunit ChlD